MIRPALLAALALVSLTGCKSIRDAAGDFSITLGTPIGSLTVNSKLVKDVADATVAPVIDPALKAVGLDAPKPAPAPAAADPTAPAPGK